MACSRLEALAGRIPQAAVIADIGCDHGLLCDILLAARPQLKVIASDVSRPSLDKARRRLGSRYAPERFDVRLGDGLSVLSWGEADIAVIAGMGGHAIIRILTQEPQARGMKGLMLSPHTNAEALRTFVRRGDYTAEKEWILYERGRFYPLLFVRPGGRPEEPDPFWDWAGRPDDRTDPVVRRYFRDLREKTAAAYRGARGHDPVRAALLEERLIRLKRESDGYERTAESN